MSHPDDSTIERFVIGALGEDDHGDFIAHVAACDECSQKLQREAALELAMVDVQKRADGLHHLHQESSAEARPVAAPAHLPFALARRSVGATLVFAAAAAVLVGLGAERLRAHRTSESADRTGASAVAIVSCPDGPKQLGCIAEAHRSARLLEYPKGTPLAALGTEPGLSVYIDPRTSDGAPLELDAFLAQVKPALETCARDAIVSEEGPIRTGEVGITFTIAPKGGVEETSTSLALHEPLRYPDLDEPMPSTDAALAHCLRRTVHAFPFKGTGRPVQVSLLTKYVWRE